MYRASFINPPRKRYYIIVKITQKVSILSGPRHRAHNIMQYETKTDKIHTDKDK